MRYNLLGKTGLRVSSISLGTVEIGVEYGIQRAGKPNRPCRNDAIRLLDYAVHSGINLFDTAPNYGISEELVGEAVGGRSDCHVASKVSIPAGGRSRPSGKELDREINLSIEKSLRSLRRNVIDVVQIHNADLEVIRRGDIASALLRAKKSGKARFLGASLYGEDAALAAIDAGCFDVIQLPYNILDQRMAQKVFSSARQSGVGIIGRSALLKGVLTDRSASLPDELRTLRQASDDVVSGFGIAPDILPQFAIRFCLSSAAVSAVLVGAGNRREIDIAINAASSGRLDDERLETALNLAMYDEELLNPTNWPIP